MDRRQRRTSTPTSRPTYILSPEGATTATAGVPTLTFNNVTFPDYSLDYHATQVNSAFWYVAVPGNTPFNGGVMEIYSRFATSATGTLGWTVTTRAVGTNTAWSAAGVSTTITNGAIPTTACRVFRQSKALTVSGWSESKILQVKIARNATGDSAGGRAKFMKAVLRLTKDGN